MARYLVLGRGVLKAGVDYLLRQPDTDLVGILDKDKSVLELDRMFSNFPKRKVDYIWNDIHRINLVELFKLYDTVISGLLAKENPRLAEAAIKANVNFCDLGGVVSIAKEIIDLRKKYPSSFTKSVVTGTGLMPGDGETKAQKLIWEFDHPIRVSILVTGLPQNPKPPFWYNFPYSSVGLEHLCCDQAPVLEKGEIVWKNPFSGYKHLTIPELARFYDKGRVEAFITAGTSLSTETFQRQGVEEYSELTLRWKGFADFFKNIPREKFQKTIAPYLTRPDRNDPDFVYMKVSVSGYISNKWVEKSISHLDLFDEVTEFTAMERSTAIPAAIVARMMTNGQTNLGINTPETAFSREQMGLYLKELSKYFDIKYTENA